MHEDARLDRVDRRAAVGRRRHVVHVLPPSVLRSKCTRHLLGCSGDSVLVGLRSVPSASRTGLFLIGPRMPSGSRVASLQVRPAVARGARHAPPLRGLGPDLVEQRQRAGRGSNSTGFQQGCRVPSGCTPLATSTGAVHAPLTSRAIQMPTSGAPSRVPPNHAATRPSFVATMVEA